MNLTDEVLNIGPAERYSFIFRGSFNAAEELVEDDGTLDELPLCASGHDGLVVYLCNDDDDCGKEDDDDDDD